MDALDINASEQEANKKFRGLIDEAQGHFSRRIDNLFHNYNQYENKTVKGLKEQLGRKSKWLNNINNNKPKCIKSKFKADYPTEEFYSIKLREDRVRFIN